VQKITICGLNVFGIGESKSEMSIKMWSQWFAIPKKCLYLQPCVVVRDLHKD